MHSCDINEHEYRVIKYFIMQVRTVYHYPQSANAVFIPVVSSKVMETLMEFSTLRPLARLCLPDKVTNVR